MKSGSTWYSTDSSWPDLPNGRKISGWVHQFPGKLAVHPGFGATQLTISKSLRNPPSSCAARHPPAFEQLEYCWPWNIVGPPVDRILFGQLRLSAVQRAYNKGCFLECFLLDVSIHCGRFHGQWVRRCGALLARVRVRLVVARATANPGFTPHYFEY
jgi:hypothetical protein